MKKNSRNVAALLRKYFRLTFFFLPDLRLSRFDGCYLSDRSHFSQDFGPHSARRIYRATADLTSVIVEKK